MRKNFSAGRSGLTVTTTTPKKTGAASTTTASPWTPPRVDKLGAVPSVEADILTMLDAAEASAEQARRTAALIEQIKSCLTGTQYRRLWMLYARKMNVTAIARAEGISKASASRSISAALKNISAFFPEGGENR